MLYFFTFFLLNEINIHFYSVFQYLRPHTQIKKRTYPYVCVFVHSLVDRRLIYGVNRSRGVSEDILYIFRRYLPPFLFFYIFNKIFLAWAVFILFYFFAPPRGRGAKVQQKYTEIINYSLLYRSAENPKLWRRFDKLQNFIYICICIQPACSMRMLWE